MMETKTQKEADRIDAELAAIEYACQKNSEFAGVASSISAARIKIRQYMHPKRREETSL